jgi:hypothetical protein
MFPLQVDPSWYERYWLRPRPARRHWTVPSTLIKSAGRAVDALQRIRRSNSPRSLRCTPVRTENGDRKNSAPETNSSDVGQAVVR